MDLSRRVDMITSTLDDVYPNPTTEITWDLEEKGDLFALCAALLLSPRCKDSTVNVIVQRLLKENLLSPKAILENPERTKEVIRPAGFQKTKGKHMLRMAEKFHFDEKWRDLRKDPRAVTFKDLTEFGGIGPKCASVIQCCLGDWPDIFPVDIHVKRCALRWGLTNEMNVNRISRDLEKLLPREDWSKRHFQIVLYGRYKCKNRDHDECEMCEKLGLGF